MKRVFFIGLMVLLIAIVGSANAESVILTEDNSNVNRDNPGTLPDGIINVQVTYNPTAGTITYKDMSPHGSNGGTTPYIGDPKIDEIGYNLDINQKSIISYDNNQQISIPWSLDNKLSLDGFGDFERDYTTDGANNLRPDTVIVTLVSTTTNPIPKNSEGYQIALHLAFDGAYDKNGNAILDPEGKPITNLKLLGSTFLAGNVTNVPEFPTMALPVAAILGVMFIFGNRKKE